MNRAILMGRLGGDPETKEVGSNVVTNFTLATNERWTGPDGERKERTDWHRCEVFGKPGKVLSQYAKKGDRILVEGRIRVNQSERDGQKRTFVSVNVDRFEFVENKKDAAVGPKDDLDEMPF